MSKEHRHKPTLIILSMILIWHGTMILQTVSCLARCQAGGGRPHWEQPYSFAWHSGVIIIVKVSYHHQDYHLLQVLHKQPQHVLTDQWPSGRQWIVFLRGVPGVPGRRWYGGLPHLRIPTLPSPWQADTCSPGTHNCSPDGTLLSLTNTLRILLSYLTDSWPSSWECHGYKDELGMIRFTRWSARSCWTLVCSWSLETGRRTWRSSTLPLPPSGEKIAHENRLWNIWEKTVRCLLASEGEGGAAVLVRSQIGCGKLVVGQEGGSASRIMEKVLLAVVLVSPNLT